MATTEYRFTDADWSEVIVPELERSLGSERAAEFIALVPEDQTTGVKVRLLIKHAGDRKDFQLLWALKRGADALEKKVTA